MQCHKKKRDGSDCRDELLSVGSTVHYMQSQVRLPNSDVSPTATARPVNEEVVVVLVLGLLTCQGKARSVPGGPHGFAHSCGPYRINLPGMFLL